jgi:hypothetical protein
MAARPESIYTKSQPDVVVSYITVVPPTDVEPVKKLTRAEDVQRSVDEFLATMGAEERVRLSINKINQSTFLEVQDHITSMSTKVREGLSGTFRSGIRTSLALLSLGMH